MKRIYLHPDYIKKMSEVLYILGIDNFTVKIEFGKIGWITGLELGKLIINFNYHDLQKHDTLT
jgi:hypothetical protein